MKRLLFLSGVSVFLVIVSFVSGFSGLIPSNSAIAAEPVRGGILKVITSGSFPKVLGYPPEMGPGDHVGTVMISEWLLRFGKDGWEPGLVKSYDEDPVNKTITWHLYPGVTYHDGTPADAESIRWNFQLLIDSKRLADLPLLDRMEVVDKHTLKMYLNDFTSSVAFNYGFNPMYSPTAIEKNGIEWARNNPVGTGPFKLVKFQRDIVLQVERNDNYWKKGKPYLDGIEVRLIPDPVTASAMMKRGEAHMWLSPTLNNALELEKSGFKLNWGPGFANALLFNSNDPKSIFANKKVREAIEYSIDRTSLAKMLSMGTATPLTQFAIPGRPGYIEGFDPRPYNLEKARQLLKEAGFPNGLKTELLISDSAANRDFGAAIQGYLAKAGIDLKLDIADIGRYYASAFRQGWKGMVTGGTGVNPDWLSCLLGGYGPNPFVYRSGSLYKSPEWLGLCEKAMHTYDFQDRQKVIKDMVKQMSDDAMLTPLYLQPQAVVLQPYLHSEAFTLHVGTWESENDWIEKH